MGKVYLAEQTPLGRPVALKIMGLSSDGSRSEELRQRFILEASTCAQLNHPNIVTLHDYGQTKKGDLYLVMEYVDGFTLDAVLKSERRLTPARTCNIMLQVCRALRAAHHASFVHRDLKPSNIMLVEDVERGERVKVIDFGLAKAFESQRNERSAELTRPGGWIGSPPYMAPEQFRNLECGPQTDIYSLGVIVFRCLFGVAPFTGESHIEVMEKHLGAPVHWPPEAMNYPELSVVIERCLHKRPNQRYGSVKELMLALNDAARASNISVDPASSNDASGPESFEHSLPTKAIDLSQPDGTSQRSYSRRSYESLPAGSAAPFSPSAYGSHSGMGMPPGTMANLPPSNEVLLLWWLLVAVLGIVLSVLIFLLGSGIGA